MTNNFEILTALYTETVGVKIRSSRGCCTGPLGILEDRVKDKRTKKWIALAVRKDYHHKILLITQALSTNQLSYTLTSPQKLENSISDFLL